MKKKYYHFDIETRYKYEITKEEHKAFEKLWNSCLPEIFKKLDGKIIIYGTGGSSNDFAEKYIAGSDPY